MGKQRRVITCMTGSRADYPRVKAVLEEICSRPNLELNLVVTGAHLSREFGYTVEEIEEDGFNIAAKVDMYTGDDTPYGMAKSAARCADGVADALKRIGPDLFLLTVDRIETLAAAQSAALMNIPIAHIQGGEVTGTIDESIRHAVTKLSHIHFPATADAKERIVRMGEDAEYVYAVGCPYLDMIRTLRYKDRDQLAVEYEFDPQKPLILFCQHPVTTEYGQATDQIRKTISALNGFTDVEIVAIYSNADAGGREIIKMMKKGSKFHVFPNIVERDYLSLMKLAALIIGNSSAGIREAPSFKLPAVNIGTRQNGRFRAANVIDVGDNTEAITNAIQKALYDHSFKESLRHVTNPYGDGFSARRIVDILEKIKLSEKLIQKRIMY